MGIPEPASSLTICGDTESVISFGVRSSSVTVTVTVTVTAASYPAPLERFEMVTVRLLSALSTSSSPPVTVTGFAVDQSLVVKVKLVGLTVAAAGLPLATATVTVPVGWVFNLTV